MSTRPSFSSMTYLPLSSSIRKSGCVRSAVQEPGHLLLEGVGAGNQVEGRLGGLDGRVALGVVGMERFPASHGLALAEGSSLQFDGAMQVKSDPFPHMSL